jgi:hypothetical protein
MNFTLPSPISSRRPRDHSPSALLGYRFRLTVIIKLVLLTRFLNVPGFVGRLTWCSGNGEQDELAVGNRAALSQSEQSTINNNTVFQKFQNKL